MIKQEKFIITSFLIKMTALNSKKNLKKLSSKEISQKFLFKRRCLKHSFFVCAVGCTQLKLDPDKLCKRVFNIMILSDSCGTNSKSKKRSHKTSAQETFNFDSDPGYFSRFTDFFFLTKQNFIFFVLFYSLIFMLELDQPFRNEENFIISIFAPWIRIFLRIWSQEAKILRILRILSTVNLYKPLFRWMIMIYRLIYHHQQSQVLIHLLITFVHAAEEIF